MEVPDDFDLELVAEEDGLEDEDFCEEMAAAPSKVVLDDCDDCPDECEWPNNLLTLAIRPLDS